MAPICRCSDQAATVVDRFRETNCMGGWGLTQRPHPEEARSAVSKDGRWHDFVWPSFETRARARSSQDEFN